MIMLLFNIFNILFVTLSYTPICILTSKNNAFCVVFERQSVSPIEVLPNMLTTKKDMFFICFLA